MDKFWYASHAGFSRVTKKGNGEDGNPHSPSTQVLPARRETPLLLGWGGIGSPKSIKLRGSYRPVALKSESGMTPLAALTWCVGKRFPQFTYPVHGHLQTTYFRHKISDEKTSLFNEIPYTTEFYHQSSSSFLPLLLTGVVMLMMRTVTMHCSLLVNDLT